MSDDLLCKIADFGLSRSLENGGDDGEYSVSVSVVSKCRIIQLQVIKLLRICLKSVQCLKTIKTGSYAGYSNQLI